MSDYKRDYSDNSKDYINNIVPSSNIDLKHYNVSKQKEKLYNDDWNKQKVNLNAIVNKFAPNSKGGYKSGYKYIFSGEKYDVVTDMVAGYLKIIDKKTNQPLKLNGKPGSKKETHFKILKRSEM